MDPKKKASYLSALGDYHAAMNILSTATQEDRQ